MASPAHVDGFVHCHQPALARKVQASGSAIEDIAALWNCALLEGCRSAAACKKAAIALIQERSAPRRS